MEEKPSIGFIGQGFIGKNYADDFERRGYSVVRYALEDEYKHNRERIADCDIVFIAVPTPTTPEGFDDSIVRAVLKEVGAGKIAVIKSTLKPGTTESVQEQYQDVFVMHSPEFLTEANAAYDAAHPDRNIVGIPRQTEEYKKAAQRVLSVLPEAPYARIMASKEAELLKYAGNCFLFTKVIFMNLLYDLAESYDADFDTVREALAEDPRIGKSHMNPVHKSGHDNAEPGRGAGGHCFIKDFEVFLQEYQSAVRDEAGAQILAAMRDKNNALLRQSGKDIDLLEGVYGTK